MIRFKFLFVCQMQCFDRSQPFRNLQSLLPCFYLNILILILWNFFILWSETIYFNGFATQNLWQTKIQK
jgi:hypothetical protein